MWRGELSGTDTAGSLSGQEHRHNKEELDKEPRRGLIHHTKAPLRGPAVTEKIEKYKNTP